MKYEIEYHPFSSELKTVNRSIVPMSGLQALDLAEKAIKTARRELTDSSYKCRLEDGRTRWMVTYDKYNKVVARNKELQERIRELEGINDR